MSARSAANAAKSLINQFKGLKEVAEALDEIADLDAHIDELNQAAEKAKNEKYEADRENQETQQALTKSKDKLVELRDRVKLVIPNAEGAASRITSDARIEGERIIAEAEGKAEGLLDQIAVDKREHKDYMLIKAEELQELQDKIDVANAERAKIRDSL